jgi:hypothetical protein
MKQVLDVYMASFPNTPSWNSLENITFEMSASGNPNNYVITQFANYGATTYPDRFGVWREDLSACTNLATTTGHWGVIASHPCRTGAQMVWNVQDGPTRMNQCGAIVPNNKDLVLAGAINKGLETNMRYMEIYKIDIDDATLSTILQIGHDRIMDVYNVCNPIVLGLNENGGEFSNTEINIYPNPFSLATTLQTDNLFKNATLTVYNSYLQQVKQIKNISGQTITLYRDNLPSGLYFVYLTQDNKTLKTKKLLITD